MYKLSSREGPYTSWKILTKGKVGIYNSESVLVIWVFVTYLRIKKETFASHSFILSYIYKKYIYLQLSISLSLKKKELEYSQIKNMGVS